MDVLPPRLVLFDGVCVVCDAGMTWLMDHDSHGRLHYAPLQGDTAAQVLGRHELPEDLDSMVLVEQTEDGERVSVHSEALWRILAQLDAPWRWLSVMRWVPRFLRDGAYRAFAARRYRVFGTRDSCRMPTAEEAALFLP